MNNSYCYTTCEYDKKYDRGLKVTPSGVLIEPGLPYSAISQEETDIVTIATLPLIRYLLTYYGVASF